MAFASRTLTKAQRSYSATRRELLALVWGVRHFRPYLLGTHFVARTDQSATQAALRRTDQSATQAALRRCSTTLQALWAQRKQLVLPDGIVYRVWLDSPGKGQHKRLVYRVWLDIPGKGQHKRLQLVLPRKLVPQILDQLHNSPTAGHLGTRKTLEKVRIRFY